MVMCVTANGIAIIQLISGRVGVFSTSGLAPRTAAL